MANIQYSLQDKDGFIWLASEKGLLRYDGSDIKSLTSLNPLFQTLNITGLIEGTGDHLWIGTKNSGLILYERKSAEINFYSASNSQKFNYISSQIDSLFYKNNNLYIGSKNTIQVLSENSLKLKKTYTFDDDDIITKIFIDSKGNIWCSAIYKNLYQISQGNIISHKYDSTNTDSISSNFINTIFEDSLNRIWIGTFSGIDLYQPQTRGFIRYIPYTTSSKKFKNAGHWSNGVSDIIEDYGGELWLSLSHSGIVKFNPELATFDYLSNIRGLNSSLLDDRVYGLLFDNQNTLWSFTNKGISRIYENAKRIEQWANIAEDGCKPTSISERSNSIYFACKNKLFQIKSKNSIRLIYEFSSWISSIQYGKNNIIWIGTSGDGIYRLDKQTLELRQYKFYTSINEPFAVNTVRKLILSNNILYGWLARSPNDTSSGLVQYQPNKDRFKNLKVGFELDDFFDINNEKLLFLQEFENESLNWFNKDSLKIEHLPIATGKTYDAIVKENNVWISSERKGVFLLNINSSQIIQLGTLGIETITSFHLNKETDDLYATTTSNIYKLIISKNKVSVECLSCSMFLGSTEKFRLRNTFLSSHNFFYAGFKNRLVRINLNTSNTPSLIGKLYLTDLKVMNESVLPETSNPHSLLKKNIEYTNQIEIPHDNTSFAINFARLDFIQSEKTQYAYTMEGLDNKWIYTNSYRRNSTYTSLPHGKYIFKVKSKKHLEYWNDTQKPISLHITVLTPWWKTWWFYISIFLLLSFSLVIFLWEIYQRKTFEKSQRSAIELAAVKDRLFTNLSHEFRTPLTLIIGPAKAIKQGKNIAENVSLIEHNGKRLLSMVDKLLDLAKLKNEKNIPFEAQNIVVISQLIIDSFSLIAKDKSIELSLFSKINGDCWISSTKDALETILFNLIANALKFTPGNGSIVLKLACDSENVECRVVDSGCGIHSADLSRIFDRFTRLDSTQDYIRGLGIGLSLVKELTESIGGTIKVKSEINKGSCFTVIFNRTKEPTESQSIPFVNNDFSPFIDNLRYIEYIKKSEYQPQKMETNEITKKPEEESIILNEKPKVLIVEDNPEMTYFIKLALESQYETFTACNGEEGILLANEEIPDLIISDVMMPKIDGFKMLEIIRNKTITSHIPVILLTARGDQESKLKGLSGLADDYMTKPFDTNELLIRIDNLLSIRSLLQQRTNQDISINQVNSLADIAKEDKDWLHSEKEFIQKLNNILEQLFINPEAKVCDIAFALHMTERQLFRKLKAVLNLTPANYLRNFRLQKALLMLQQGKTVNNVAYDTGFSSPTNFSRSFKAKFGSSPSKHI